MSFHNFLDSHHYPFHTVLPTLRWSSSTCQSFIPFFTYLRYFSSRNMTILTHSVAFIFFYVGTTFKLSLTYSFLNPIHSFHFTLPSYHSQPFCRLLNIFLVVQQSAPYSTAGLRTALYAAFYVREASGVAYSIWQLSSF